MEFTLEELKERLARFEECYLLELLQVTSDQLVQRFDDIIEEHFEDLLSELEEDENQDDQS